MKHFCTLLFSFLLIVFCAQAQLPAEFSNFNAGNTSGIFTTTNFKAIAVDRFGAVWAGSQYGGLYTFTSSSHTWIKSTDLTNVFINDIKASKRGGVYVAQSGISGATSSEGNRNGDIHYYADEFYSTVTTYGVNGVASGNGGDGGGLTSRNVKSLFIDTAIINTPDLTRPRVWAAQGSFLTNSNTAPGGIAQGLNQPGMWSFNKINKGLQIFPNTNMISSGTPMVEAIGGNKKEVWAFARTNYGGSQILRYDAHSAGYLGGFNNVGQFNNTRMYYSSSTFTYVNTVSNVLPGGFRISAIYFDSEDRRWLGTPNGYGGLYVVQGSLWTKVVIPSIGAGLTVNNNAIAEDAEGNVYIGTTSGLLMFQAGSDPTLASSYQLITMSNGMASNNVQGVAVDNNAKRIVMATDAGVTFWTRLKPVTTTLAWDYSFPKLEIVPRGVAADGVSRVYMKIKRSADTIPPIKQVEVILKDYTAGTANMHGRVRRADNMTSYSNEATTGAGSEASRTDSTPAGEFWFWYVSPEDFSGDANGWASLLPERRDTIKIRVTYDNDKKDSTEYTMRVVRPPLLLVHGLAAGPDTWDSCRPASGPLGELPYVSNPIFKYKKALKMDGKGLFADNAKRLLSGDEGDLDAKQNSLQGNIEEMRNMGFAANQVDYVCHSMGGIMIRGAIGWFPGKFRADGNYLYNNYANGFVHKLIFVNTPHNSSPVADAVREFVPKFPGVLRFAFTQLYKADPKLQQPFDFVQPLRNTLNDPAYIFRSSDAVTNLEVSDQFGGVNLPATNNVKNHLIIGDVNLSSQVLDDLVEMKPLAKLINNCMVVARDLYPQAAKDALAPYFDENKTEIDRMLFFVNWYSALKNFPSFTADGDLIVPLKSELAQQNQSNPNITSFTNTPGHLIDANHIAMLPRRDVGKRIFDLLNMNVNNNTAFGDFIPANTDPEPIKYFRANKGAGAEKINDVQVYTFYDTSRVKIDTPIPNSSVTGGNTFTVTYRLKDTVGLAYIDVRFQNTDSFRARRNSGQQVTLKTDPVYAGAQTLYVYAVYDKPDGVYYYVDSTTVGVAYNGALQGFRIKEDAATISTGINFYPGFEVQYNGQWLSLPNGNATVTVTFDSANVVNYNTTTKAFTGLKNGFAVATVNYQGLEDEILLTSILSHEDACTNRTITSGNFKDPAIWSKGLVPVFCDSILIQHNVTLDTSMQITSMRIQPGAVLTMNNAAYTLRLGGTSDGRSTLDNFGTLNITAGTLKVQGLVRQNAASTFAMSGGLFSVGGNTGVKETAVAEGLALFQAVPGMTSFSFTGGTLQIVDPPFSSTGNSLDCGYNFGPASILMLGDGVSTVSSNNPSGFGGNLFPDQIGKLIVNGVVQTGNRQFFVKKPLTVKGSLEVKAGSGVVQEQSLRVEQ
ncbi:MAG: hypothetical protein ABIX01_02730 [Chitinophagaceae bacterium]